MSNSGRTQRPGRRTEGAALVTALLAAVAITLLMFALTSVRVSEVRAIANTTQFTQAQMAAEAGIESVIALIRTNGAVPTTEITGPIAGASFTATATSGTDPDTGEALITVVSRGEYADVARTLETQLQAIYANELLEEYALLVCHDLTVSGSASVVGGDIYSGGDLTISKTSGLVNGDARAKGNILLQQEFAVTGNVISKTGTIDGTNAGNKVVASGYAARPIGAPSVSESEVGSGVVTDDPTLTDIPDYCDDLGQPAAQINDTFFTDPDEDWIPLTGPVDSASLPASLESGATYFIKGDLTLNADLDADVTFVVTGDLAINGNVTIGSADNDASDLALVVDGNVLKGNGNATINGVLYSNGFIDLGNGSLEINGAAVLAGTSEESSLSGNFTINYEPSTNTDLPNLELVDVVTSRWRIISN